MVLTKKDLDDALESIKLELQSCIQTSIESLKTQIIDNLVSSNKVMQSKIKVLENTVYQLEIDLQASLQYNRLNNLVISGIPKDVEHSQLKQKAVGIINTCLDKAIDGRDLEACHRISKKSADVVCRFVNREDVDGVLANRKKLKNIDKNGVGLPENGEIYVNTHLTPYRAKLAYYCRRLKHQDKIISMSTWKGIIKIQVRDELEAVWKTINHIDELTKMFPDLLSA